MHTRSAFFKGATWIPLQYYSNNCEEIFNKTSFGIITRSNEQEALCIDTKSQLSSSISESRLAFSTLEGRPSAYEFDTSPVLQDWVTATDIKIVLYATELARTFYSMADLAVGGRCKCNGHASKCLANRYENEISLDPYLLFAEKKNRIPFARIEFLRLRTMKSIDREY